MIDAKTLGWIKIVGAVVAGWLGWRAVPSDWGVVVLALVILIAGLSHAFGKK